ncbi:WD repeat-containing protein 93 [Xenentodon cancila]
MKKACKAEKFREPPTLEPSGATQLPENTNCLACSEDGIYLCLGHSRGLSVWCASSLTHAVEWLQDGLEVNFIQTTRMLELTYLLGTVDDMGVARLFLHHSDGIHLLSVINAMEDINKRRVCLTLDLFEGGLYGAASFSCNGAVWIEVYQFPSVAWLKELRMAETQKQVMSSGLPVAVAVWWSGSHNLHQYLLHKAPQNKPGNVDPMPDVLWPNAKEIQCSAVSRCTRYIALGLCDALVCVWDRLTGAPLSVVLVPTQSRTLSKIQFFDHWPVSAQDSQSFIAEMLHLLVLCNDGANCTVTIGRGTQPCTRQFTVRPKDSRDLQTVTTSVPFLQGVSFVVQRNGRMFLQDVINRVNLCFLTLPTSHQITSPCSPVYVLSSTQQSLFIRGDLDTSHHGFSRESSQSQLFVFHFGESDIMKQHTVLQPESAQRQQTLSHATPEEICDLYLQQRVLAVDKRNKAIAQTWERLQEAAVMLQQGQQLRNANK